MSRHDRGSSAANLRDTSYNPTAAKGAMMGNPPTAKTNQ